MREITKRQLEMLHFIDDFQKSNGYVPTIREIGSHFNITSTNGVNDHLRALEHKGYIAKVAGKSRTIKVVHIPFGMMSNRCGPAESGSGCQRVFEGARCQNLESHTCC